jgi:hypothetical protein
MLSFLLIPLMNLCPIRHGLPLFNHWPPPLLPLLLPPLPPLLPPIPLPPALLPTQND